jgi:hypothetical protein
MTALSVLTDATGSFGEMGDGEPAALFNSAGATAFPSRFFPSTSSSAAEAIFRPLRWLATPTGEKAFTEISVILPRAAMTVAKSGGRD